MIKSILHAIGIIVLTAMMAACSSPEEKAAGYIENADQLFQEGDLIKAEIEYKNALQDRKSVG